MASDKPKHLTGEALENLEEAQAALDMPPTAYTLDESQRQLVLMAIADLALKQPGFDFALGEIADCFEAREMYNDFKVVRAT